MAHHMSLDTQALLERPLKAFQECMESGLADGFLTVLLNLMAIVLLVNPKFKENIRDFKARYVFRTKDGHVAVTAVFDGGRMQVWPWEFDKPKPNIIVSFQNPQALMAFLMSNKPDVLGSMLRQEVSLEGNLNYLYKFAYMARHLQLMANQLMAHAR